jgi:hypothetical protein
VDTKHNNGSGGKQLSIRLPQADLDRLKAVAAANERSVSGEIRFALIKHLRERGETA